MDEAASAVRDLSKEMPVAADAMRGTGAAADVLRNQVGNVSDEMLRAAGVNADMAAGLQMLPPVLLAVGVAAAVAIKAYSDGAAEAREFSKALILSGNAAGTSVQDLQNYAIAVAESAHATQGAAAGALAKLAESGDVAAAGLAGAAEAALLLERVGVQSIDKTAAQFSALGKAPVEASLKLNEQYRYLTGAVFEQIVALEAQGHADEAAEKAQRAYGDEMARRARQIAQEMGTLQSAWMAVGVAAKGAWDKMLNIGREQPFEVQIKALQAQLRSGSFDFALTEDDIRTQISGLQQKIALRDKETQAAAATGAQDQASVKWIEQGIQYRSKQQKMENEILQTRQLGVAAGMSEEKINERIAAVREKYAEKSKQSLKATRDELALLLNALDGKDSGLDSGYWKNLDTLHAAYRSGRLSLDAYRDAVEKLTTQQRFYKDSLKEVAKAEADRARAINSWVDQAARHADGLAQQNERLVDEIELLGLDKTAQGEYRAAKLESAAATAELAAQALDEAAALLAAQGVLPDVVDGYYALAQAKRAASAASIEQAGLMREKAAKEVAINAAKESDKAWEKFSDDIERSLTDSLYRAFEAGDDYGEAFAKSLQNTFKAMALKFAVQMTVSSAGSAVGSLIGGDSGGAGSVGSAGNLLSSGSSLYSAVTGGGIGGLVSGFGAGAASAASELALGASFVGPSASLAGGAVGAGASAGLATGSSAASGALSTIAAAAPYIAAVAGIISLIGSKKIFGGERVYNDSYILGNVNSSGFSGATGQDWQKDGGWFGKNRSGTEWTAASAELDTYFDDIASGLRTQMIKLGESLGDTSVASLLDGWSMGVSAMSTTGDMGAMGQQVAEQMAKSMALTVAPVLNDVMSRTGSTDWAGSLTAMVAQAAGVDQALKLVGTSLEDTFGKQKINDVLWVTDQFARMFGSVENMGNQLSAYVQNFYSEAEISEKSFASLGDQFAALGQSMPETKAEFRSLVESLDLTSESGRQTFASLMALSPAFAQVVGAAEAAQQKMLEQRQSWQDKLDVLTGATTDRALQLQADLAATTDETTQALIRQVYAQEDMNTAAQAASAAAQAAAEAAAAQAAEAQQRAAAIASQRYGLESQLLQAQGDTVALRERELAALDESNRALQQQIWALEDAKTAATASAQAAQESAQAESARQAEIERQASAAAQAAAAIASERDGLQKQLWQAQGDTVALRQAELDALNPANRALQEQIWALEDLATAAQKAAQVESERMGLQKQLWQVQGNTAALRQAELAALDPANRALQQQIWALEDSKSAADEWTRTWENLNQSLRDQAKKLRNEIAGGASAASLQAQFAVATAQARAGDAAAAGRLVGLSDQVMSAYGKTAGSSLDVSRMAASLAGSLEKTAIVSDLSAPAGNSDSSKTAQNTAAMASEIKQLRADSQAQAAAMARLLSGLAKITSRWDVDGMPSTRVEAA